MASAVPAAIDGLLAVLAGLPAMTDPANPVTVSDGYPATRAADMVSVGGAVDVVMQATQTYITIGGTEKEERFDIVGLISCFRNGSTGQRDARVRAFALLAAITDGIAVVGGDFTLGGTVRLAELTGHELRQTTEADATSGRFAEITFTITCEQRIT